MDTKKFSQISFIILSLLMIGLALSYWPNADDFCFRSRVQTDSLTNYLIQYYHSWSGRVFTLGILGIFIELLPLMQSNIISSLFVLLYLYSLYQLVGYIRKYIPVDWTTGLLITFFLGWFGLRAIIGEIVYWPTGAATYLVPFVLGLWWMREFDQDLEKNETTTPKMIGWFLVSIVVGNGIEVLSPILCAYGGLLFILNYKKLSKSVNTQLVLKLLGIVLGTLFLVLAPGNAERAKSFPQGITFDVISLLTNLLKVSWVFFSFTKTMLMYVVITTLFMIVLAPDLNSDDKKLRKTSLLLFIVSLASLVPMATVDLRFSTRRTTFYFATTLSLSLLFWLYSHREFIKSKLKFLNNLKIRNLVLLILLVAPATSLVLDIKQAYPMRQKFSERHAFLNIQTKHSDEIFMLETMGEKAPKSLFYEEITHDENHWVNACIAHYYKLKFIRLKDEAK